MSASVQASSRRTGRFNEITVLQNWRVTQLSDLVMQAQVQLSAAATANLKGLIVLAACQRW